MAAGLWGALAGAGLGLGKHYLSDKPAYQSEAELASTQTRYSPWSKMGMGKMPDKRPSLFNNVMQGAVGGAMQGMSMGQPGMGEQAGAGIGGDMGAEGMEERMPSAEMPTTAFGGGGMASGDSWTGVNSRQNRYFGK